jgi:hypothetical protein
MNHRPLLAYYGRIATLKLFCQECDAYAFVIDGKFTCCDKKVEDDGSVIKCKRKRESISPFMRDILKKKERAEILSHQNWQCLYCGKSLRGKTQIAFDHVIPFSYSGESASKLNSIACCKLCNLIKGPRLFNSVEEARIYVINKLKEKNLPFYDYFGGGYELHKI